VTVMKDSVYSILLRSGFYPCTFKIDLITRLASTVIRHMAQTNHLSSKTCIKALLKYKIQS